MVNNGKRGRPQRKGDTVLVQARISRKLWEEVSNPAYSDAYNLERALRALQQTEQCTPEVLEDAYNELLDKTIPFREEAKRICHLMEEKYGREPVRRTREASKEV